MMMMMNYQIIQMCVVKNTLYSTILLLVCFLKESQFVFSIVKKFI